MGQRLRIGLILQRVLKRPIDGQQNLLKVLQFIESLNEIREDHDGCAASGRIGIAGDGRVRDVHQFVEEAGDLVAEETADRSETGETGRAEFVVAVDGAEEEAIDEDVLVADGKGSCGVWGGGGGREESSVLGFRMFSEELAM